MKYLLTIAIIALSSLFCFAQSKVSDRDFTGTWIASMDETKYDGKKVVVCGVSNKFEITQDGPKIIFTAWQDDRTPSDPAIEGAVYYTDDRGELSLMHSGPRFSRTKWNGKRLVSKVDGFGDIVGAVQEWYLSKDRKKLFQKLVITTRADKQTKGVKRPRVSTFTILHVFNRVASDTTV